VIIRKQEALVKYFIKNISKKHIIGLILITLVFSFGSVAQDGSSPFAKKPNKKLRTKKITEKDKNPFPFSPNYRKNPFKIVPALDITVGYLPQAEFNAVKNTVAFNNIGYTRFGVLMSFETGWDSDYSTNTVGMTATINRYLYLWIAADLLTQQGLIITRSLSGTRKEIGVGVMPYKWTLLKVGYSGSVGLSAELGFRVIM